MVINMENYIKPIIPIIESNYSNFTQVEKSIADFFINNGEKINFSAKSIAEKLFVSEASLSRFAKNVVIVVTESLYINMKKVLLKKMNLQQVI